MPTNEERREIARFLRNYADENEFKCTCVISAAVGIKCRTIDIPEECEACYTETINRLADLIEPEPERTCRIVENERYSDMYDGPIVSCTQCEAPLPKIFTGPYNFCPNCGAKVIQNV